MATVLHSSFKVIAHRGNSSQAPENTYASFLQAIELNVEYIECDVQLTKDLIPVIMHDPTTHGILPNNEVLNISALNWEDLRKLDAGSWYDKRFSGQRILSMEEFLLIPRGKVGAMIEIKDDTFKEKWMAKIVAEQMQRLSLHSEQYGPIILGSLNPTLINWLQEDLPDQDFIAIVDQVEDLEKFLQTRSKYFGLRYALATRELIQFLRSKGKEVWTWTVDDAEIAKKLVEDGVQGIISNQPKKMQLLQKSMYK